MAILMKVKGATLMETLTASVIIVIVFMMASLCINTIVKNTASKNSNEVLQRVKEVYYLNQHQKIKLPYSEDYKKWNVKIAKNSVKVLYSKKGTDNEIEYP